MSDLEAVKRERDRSPRAGRQLRQWRGHHQGHRLDLVDEQCARAYACERRSPRRSPGQQDVAHSGGSEFTVRRLTQMMEAGGTMLVADHEGRAP